MTNRIIPASKISVCHFSILQTINYNQSQLYRYMTKIAATHIYDKNPSKIFFSDTWFVASETPANHSLFKWWPWSDLGQFNGKVKFGNLGFSIGKSENSGCFSNYCSKWPESGLEQTSNWIYEGIWVLKVKVPMPCTYKKSVWIFSETAVPLWTKFCMKAFRYKEMKIWWHDAGHMAKMAAMPIYGKNPSKSSSQEPVGWFPQNLTRSILVT